MCLPWFLHHSQHVIVIKNLCAPLPSCFWQILRVAQVERMTRRDLAEFKPGLFDLAERRRYPDVLEGVGIVPKTSRIC